MEHRLAGLHYYDIDFDELGAIKSDGGLLSAVKADDRIEDLFFFAHGWNCSTESAASLYDNMFTMLAGMIPAASRRKIAVVGVNWPAILFPDDDPATGVTTRELTGRKIAAAIAPGFPQQHQSVQRLGELLDEKPGDVASHKEFRKLAAGLVTSEEPAPEEPAPGSLQPQDHLRTLALGNEVLDPESIKRARRLLRARRASRWPGILRPIAEAGLWLKDAIPHTPDYLWHFDREILRYCTYYEMKARAGVIGRAGFSKLIDDLVKSRPSLGCYLMGHSFGARLVANSLSGLAGSPVRALLMIEGALSHFAFNDIPAKYGGGMGSLEPYADLINGPQIAIFSKRDLALGLLYPLAALLANPEWSAEADAWYRCGAMGHDGFQGRPPADEQIRSVKLAAVGHPYSFEKGRQYRLDATRVVEGHSKIQHPQVVWPIVDTWLRHRLY